MSRQLCFLQFQKYGVSAREFTSAKACELLNQRVLWGLLQEQDVPVALGLEGHATRCT
jgi:hypothetical protein